MQPGGLPGSESGSAGWRSNQNFEVPVASRSKRESRIPPWARNAAHDLLTTVFPSECRVCTRPLVRAEVVPVCDACVAEVRRQKGLLCDVCGEAIGMENERFAEGFRTDAPRCTPCRRAPPAFARAVAYGVYEEELREMLHLLKYERMRGLARTLGPMLARAIDELADNLPANGSSEQSGELLVMAVPLFRAKERGRGFNHAELLADAAMRELRATRVREWRMRAAHGLLRRVRETESQFGLTPHGRRANLRGAFAAPSPELVRDRDVLLIDDIYTTGATARSCAEALRRAGAGRVFVATLARAQVERVALWDGGAERDGRNGLVRESWQSEGLR